MKPISELGLELIKLEDQVLLVDNNQIKNFDWVVDKSCKGAWIIQISEETDLNQYKRVISSTKPLERLPLLVIEDEGDADFEKYKDEVGSRYSHSLYQFSKDRIEEGYNKAKETFKFTEEDLLEAFEMGKQSVLGEIQIFQQDVVKSIIKKELYVEVELFQIKSGDKTGYTVEKLITKITDNQIKAVWKSN